MIHWLDDNTLSRIASRGASDPSFWAQRYDATCPSEFYRGYASLLTQIGEALKPSSTPATLRQLIEAFDIEIKGMSADERRNGANFALMNVAAYTQAGTVPQISATVAAELVCIARWVEESPGPALGFLIGTPVAIFVLPILARLRRSKRWGQG